MKVLFCTNIPSPYRVDFFGEFGKYCELTVCYERKTASDRNLKWKTDQQYTYTEVFLDLKPVGTDRSKGNTLKNYIASHTYDVIVLTNYVSPATVSAIMYCRIKHIPYFIEYDGGFYKTDPFYAKVVKKILLKGAEGHLTTCNEHIRYLESLGISSAQIYKYPFTSIKQSDLLERDRTQKKKIKEILEIQEENMVLTVGQFIPRKGFDILIEAFRDIDCTGVYIVGGEPSEEYIKLAKKTNPDHIHFVGFLTKKELKQYYLAADLFVLPTREDIWGLVINESMAYGLPVVTTNRCIAGLELVKDNENGFIVPSEDVVALRKAIVEILFNSKLKEKMGDNSRRIMEEYTIEKMVERHLEIFEEISV